MGGQQGVGVRQHSRPWEQLIWVREELGSTLESLGQETVPGLSLVPAGGAIGALRHAKAWLSISSLR